MKKWIDYIGITVSYVLVDPKLWILASLRSNKCRDEHFVWDLWWGGLEMWETIQEGIEREIHEETGLLPKDYKIYTLWLREMFRKQDDTKTHRIGIEHLIIPYDATKIVNKEPDKHTELRFFPFDNLPPKEQTHSQFYPILIEFKDKIEKTTGIKIQV